MIRYRIHQRELLSRIDELLPSWRTRAADRTAHVLTAGEFDGDGIWGEIKRVYMDLQGHKCGYCERRLEQSQYGSIEHDVEHYRPKSRVDGWPTPSIREQRHARIRSRDGRRDVTDEHAADADPLGYFALAFDPENYLISCKTCNSILKRNWFPVAEPRDASGTAVRDLLGEKPYLPYPIGASDPHDPEDVITFRGIVPVPAAARGHKRRRGEVTIRFFELDTREGLLRERAEVLVALHLALLLTGHDDEVTAAAAAGQVDRMIDDRAPHASCARAHHDLALADLDRAHQRFQQTAAWIAALP